MSDWKQSVEQRLGDLRTDYRNLLIGGLVAAAGLVGSGWLAYKDISADISETKVAISELAGDVRVFEAEVNGKLDRLIERTDDNAETSNPEG